MNWRVVSLLDGIGDAELAGVAAAVLEVADAAPIGVVRADAILSPHGEPRTTGIFKVSGTAGAAGQVRDWSAVAKVVDFSVPPDPMNSWVHPENEASVYTEGYFGGEGLSFRPARCYHISRPSNDIVVLWLEDLTRAMGPPFTSVVLEMMARHLGEWNGYHAGHGPSLKSPTGRDGVFARWNSWHYDEELADFQAMRDRPEMMAMYGVRPIEMAFRLRDLLLGIGRRARQHRRTLCFGDCNIGNLFFKDEETVAIDWAGLTYDPLGVDAGSMIGSAITRGRDFASVARHERALFDSYLDGLAASGWHGDRDDVRRAFLVHYGYYLLTMAMLPASLKKFPRAAVEMRMGAAWDELPALATGIVDLLPSYLEELSDLL